MPLKGQKEVMFQGIDEKGRNQNQQQKILVETYYRFSPKADLKFYTFYW